MSHNDPVLLGDRIMESPLKHCQTCKNCVACKKEMHPDQVRQIRQEEQILNNLSFDKNQGYTIAYPKNSLPENDESLKRMMKSLESKLLKNGLLSQFNECLKQFIDTGVVALVSAFPEMEMMQKSFIPLCYSMANNEQATIKLRICTNFISVSCLKGAALGRNTYKYSLCNPAFSCS